MSVYIIIPGPSGTYIKFGKTAKTTENDVTGYLYRRYRTPYGKNLVAYIWRCPKDKEGEIENMVQNAFIQHKSKGDELFHGKGISARMFMYCCENVNKRFIRYQSGVGTICTYNGKSIIESPRFGGTAAASTLEELTVDISKVSISKKNKRGKKSSRGRTSNRGGKRASTRGKTNRGRGGKRTSTRGRGGKRKSTKSGKNSTRGGKNKNNRKNSKNKKSGKQKKTEKDEDSSYCIIS